MSERLIQLNGVEISAESFGSPGDPAILLIMGAQASMVWWEEQFCRRLAAAGRFAIRYDNRDVGRSTTYEPGRPEYTFEDMADDAAGVLDAYGIKQAHICGMSMGGMLAQILALRHPARVLTLSLVATSNFAPELPPMEEKVKQFFANSDAIDWSDEEEIIRFSVDKWRVLAGSKHPLEEDRVRRLARQEVRRSRSPASMSNHGVVTGDFSYLARTAEIDVPALVIHGTEDPIIPYEHGVALANAIPKGRLLALEGSGHEIHPEEWDTVIEAIVRHTEAKLKVYALPDIAELKIHGRTTGRLSPLTLFWTGSAIELNALGTELWIEVEAAYDQYEPWISIELNSVPVSRQMLTAGKYWICVFRGMDAAAVKNVRVVKDVQAMSGDAGCCLQIHAVKSDGGFRPVEEKAYRIEFIGDSITSGEGAIGAKSETDWIPMWFSAVHNYCALTAEALNAEFRIISQSGWGAWKSWDNKPRANLPEYYEQVCGLLTGERNEALGAFEKNDFDSWQPDIVVVNLGTNDGSAISLREDDACREEDMAAFEQAVGSFLVKIRQYNKHTHIVWAYGMLGITMMPAIHRAMNAYIQRTGDRKATVFQLPRTTEATVGARNHPGRLAHERAAEELTVHLKELLRLG